MTIAVQADHAAQASGQGPLAHVVLVRPEIPQNTGSIGRTCVAVGAALHLIHPLGFDIDEKACRRAGLDYWPRLTLAEHASPEAYFGACGHARAWGLTAKGGVPLHDADLRAGDHLLFGCESEGLPAEVLDRPGVGRVTVPMIAGERSLNLSSAVAVVLYEMVRRRIADGGIRLDGQGRWRHG